MHERIARTPLLLAFLAAVPSCSGLIQVGVMAEVIDQFHEGNCAGVVQTVDESIGFISSRPELLAEAFLYKARCLERMSRRSEAAELYRYVSEQHPNTPYAYEARAFLSELEGSSP